jgi:hypothetical protein
VTLLSPAQDQTCNGPVRFSYQWSQSLWSGEAFELHLWPNEKLTRNSVGRSTSNSIVADLRTIGWINWERQAHWWEVVVVCRADGRQVSQYPPARLVYFEPRMPPNEGNPDANCR